jgi:hypothetical protein
MNFLNRDRIYYYIGTRVRVYCFQKQQRKYAVLAGEYNDYKYLILLYVKLEQTTSVQMVLKIGVVRICSQISRVSTTNHLTVIENYF